MFSDWVKVSTHLALPAAFGRLQSRIESRFRIRIECHLDSRNFMNSPWIMSLLFYVLLDEVGWSLVDRVRETRWTITTNAVYNTTMRPPSNLPSSLPFYHYSNSGHQKPLGTLPWKRDIRRRDVRKLLPGPIPKHSGTTPIENNWSIAISSRIELLRRGLVSSEFHSLIRLSELDIRLRSRGSTWWSVK